MFLHLILKQKEVQSHNTFGARQYGFSKIESCSFNKIILLLRF